MELLNFKPIGFIKTPFKSKEGMPIQSTGAQGVKGTIEIEAEYIEGLKDLDGFSHIILIYHFHLSKTYELSIKPFMDDNLRGIFSTRAPKRPNPVGFTVVKLIEIKDNLVHIENIDVIDGTPLIDIKPFIPDIDSPDVQKLGWLQGKSDKMGVKKSDNRFIE
ncbi:MAG: tRNA (N6-threonylcarbamoyladenosine(37)-N6)-methyltransferase TrmO [Bacteroidales bacterium]|nr:tRNA (N6-threonylcarbamoyladenosine(37)-N6)-methyltransferase TrmO [Bacteroidales bacterium]